MILDVCCGALTMYHNWYKKLGEDFIYIDIRTAEKHDYGKYNIYKGAIPQVKPLIQADMKSLPFKDGIIDAIIFDPPHLHEGAESFMGVKYGIWSRKEMVDTLRAVNDEFKRVLRLGGILVLKILAKDFTTYEALLSNFTFFLPIYHKSQSNLSRETVVWCIATSRPPSHIQASLDDILLQEFQAPNTSPIEQPEMSS